MQSTAANCGPASLSNALAAIGIARSEQECCDLCRTNATEGTPPRRLLAAARALGRTPLQIRERRSEVAVLFLSHWLSVGRTAVICVDEGEHWVAAVGLCGPRILIADSADNELVLSLTRAELSSRWAVKGSCYGIVI